MAHYDETKNRFNPENRFIGDIENGRRYPFACYTKEESDARYAPKSVETTVTELEVAVNGKASETDLAALSTIVEQGLAGKASQADFETLSTTVEQGLASKADESECIDIRARLDALEYQSITIDSITAAPPVSEIGSSQTITLIWELNKAATAQNINGRTVTGNIKQYIGVTTGQTYTLNVSDGQTTDERSVCVEFANRIYYGAAADISNITALTGILTNDPEITFAVNAGPGKYIIYAIPARLGNVDFFVNGFEGGFQAPVELVLTNASGYQETYKVYRSTNANLGETTVEIKEG